MYEILPQTSDDLLAIRVSGTLSKADYERLHPWLDEQLAKHPRPSLLIVMKDFSGWDSVAAMIEDLKIDMEHRNDVRRIAMVGEKAWQKWMTWASKPFTRAEVAYFEMDELEQARKWAEAA